MSKKVEVKNPERRHLKKKAAQEYNTKRPIYTSEKPRSEWKLLLDDPYYKAIFDECAKVCLEIENKIKQGIDKIDSERLKQALEKEINKRQRAVLNVFRKHYGRSKYIPH